MRLRFLTLSADERRVYFEEAARRRGLAPIIVEKDFWVCWMLGVLFGASFREALVFKGGTSLSKVFGVIHRFSEDVDLSLAPAFVGVSEVPVTVALSRSRANRWMKEAEAACETTVSERVRPELEAAIRAVLGRRNGTWIEFANDPASHSPVLYFHYPTTQPDGFDYLRRSVKLEFGSLTDQQPIGRHPVLPWLAEEILVALPDWRCDVVSLGLERTFWEKATLLHTEHHRPADRPMADRLSRHYADTAALAEHPVASQAVRQDDLRERVVAWKRMFFGSAWARYDLARPGSFRLVPQPARVPELRRDHQAMRDMYSLEPVGFDQILATLADLEARINEANGV